MTAAASPISLRALNRTTLARQMLLAREKTTPLKATERVLGLQAQDARPPYIALWSRLENVTREEISNAIVRRDLVRATTMRCTIHIVSAADYVRFRDALQPALTRAFMSVAKKRLGGFEIDDVCDEARKLLKEPMTFTEIRDALAPLHPKADARIIGYAVRSHLPLVMTPADHPWTKSGNPAFFPADKWITKGKHKAQSTQELIRRYLAAFGPATVADMQTWSGLSGLAAAVEGMRDELISLRDEKKKELFDLPKLARLSGDEEAPVRLLPEFDSILLAHAVRTRLISEEHRKKVFVEALRVRATFLVDGFVAGTWRIDADKKSATLVLEPLVKLSKPVKTALMQEAEALIAFAEPSVSKHAVKCE